VDRDRRLTVGRDPLVSLWQKKRKVARRVGLSRDHLGQSAFVADDDDRSSSDSRSALTPPAGATRLAILCCSSAISVRSTAGTLSKPFEPALGHESSRSAGRLGLLGQLHIDQDGAAPPL